MKIKNTYRCPLALWNKFTHRRKEIYNSVRGLTQDIILPNKIIDPKLFDIISHNYAVSAALELDSKKEELKLWNYLVKKLKKLKDNNLTAREIFQRVTK